MPKVTSQSVIATPTREGNAAFAIIAQTRHIDLFANNTEDKDIEEPDIQWNDAEPEEDMDIDW